MISIYRFRGSLKKYEGTREDGVISAANKTEEKDKLDAKVTATSVWSKCVA